MQMAALYHLALKAGEVSDKVITVGDPERVAKVSRYFDTIELRREKREFVTHTGKIGNQRLTVISTGIGTDNIDIVFNELHSLWEMEGHTADEPYHFVRLGTSGAVRSDQKINSILLSEAALGFDGLMHFYEWQQSEDELNRFISGDVRWQKLPRPYVAYAGDVISRQFRQLAESSGITVTAPGFYAPQGRNVNAPARVPDFIQLLSQSSFGGKPITNIEMETAGIYGMAALLGHQAVSLSAILANRHTGEFSKEPEIIVEKMIRQALDLIIEA